MSHTENFSAQQAVHALNETSAAQAAMLTAMSARISQLEAALRPGKGASNLQIKFAKLNALAIEPTYATDGSGALDVYAFPGDPVFSDVVPVDENNSRGFQTPGAIVRAGDPKVFKTGIAFEVPYGWSMLILGRSGHGIRKNVRLSNCVGLLDSDYRGEMTVGMIADEDGQLVVKPGDRICQIMLVPTPRVDLIEVHCADLEKTARADGGLGSTGS